MRNLIMRLLIAALALAGVIDSGLALKVHYADPGSAPPCAVTENFDCGAVNHSRYSVFPPRTFDEAPDSKKLHIPVAVFGLAGYALILILALLGRWWAVLQLAEIAFGAATFLSYLEAFVIEKWCIYCLWSQAIITAIVIATIVALILRKREGHRLDIPAPAASQQA